MKRGLFLLLLGVGGAYLFRTFAYEGIYVASESMEPNFPKDRHIMVNKFILWFKKPKHGDVVMFDSPLDTNKGLIKRVIAVGGDTLEIRAKKVYLNGSFLREPYAEFLKPDEIFVGDNWPSTQIPENTYFVMGDNRDFSGDSRDWKNSAGERIPFLPLSHIKGIVESR